MKFFKCIDINKETIYECIRLYPALHVHLKDLREFAYICTALFLVALYQLTVIS